MIYWCVLAGGVWGVSAGIWLLLGGLTASWLVAEAFNSVLVRVKRGSGVVAYRRCNTRLRWEPVQGLLDLRG